MCRSFLSPYKDENGNYKFYGRLNQGVVTLNLVDVALSSEGDYEKFWDWLRKCSGNYLLSFDGKTNNRGDSTYDVPKDIYSEHKPFRRI